MIHHKPSSRPIVFIGYALEPDWIEELRLRLDMITKGCHTVGAEAYAHVRDGQGWKYHQEDIRHVLDDAFKMIRLSDMIFLDLTTHGGSRRSGLHIEAGYAKALKKPIVAIWQASDRPHMVPALADFGSAYMDAAELPNITATLVQHALDLHPKKRSKQPE